MTLVKSKSKKKMLHITASQKLENCAHVFCA